jgi:uncharacterized protein (DUF2249 family)
MSAVTPDARLADVLGAHPELLDVLIHTSPAFARLRNPLMRRTMTKLVTVAQAARMGGVETPDLVQRLNTAIGCPAADTVAPTAEAVASEAPSWLNAPVGAALDVRDAIASGGEPFGLIQAAAGRVKPGERLILVAPFEPAPLYTVLAKRGFDHWCEQVGPAHYRVHFLKKGAPAVEPPEAAPSPKAAPAATSSEFAAVVTIEANLEPPLPMMQVLEALAGIAPGERLLVHHVRRPVHLLARLEAEGHLVAVTEVSTGQVEVVITKAA